MFCAARLACMLAAVCTCMAASEITDRMACTHLTIDRNGRMVPAGAGSLELPPWQVVRQGLLSLPFLFGAGVTHRLLQVRAHIMLHTAAISPP